MIVEFFLAPQAHAGNNALSLLAAHFCNHAGG